MSYICVRLNTKMVCFLVMQDCGQPGFTLSERKRFGNILKEYVTHSILTCSLVVFCCYYLSYISYIVCLHCLMCICAHRGREEGRGFDEKRTHRNLYELCINRNFLFIYFVELCCYFHKE